jgi:hypothetical protein
VIAASLDIQCNKIQTDHTRSICEEKVAHIIDYLCIDFLTLLCSKSSKDGV